MDFEEKIKVAIAKATQGTGLKPEEILLEKPKQDFGDFAFPCFNLSKILKKSPIEIAKELQDKIKPSEEIEKILANGPYLNFFVDRGKFAEQVLSNILKKQEKFGKPEKESKNEKTKEKVMVEFCQANTHKAFHVGHIRGTSLGESISRISEFIGNKVIRANYQGDIGMHVAKWIWCYQTFHKKEWPKKDIEKWVASIYVEAVKKLFENPDYQKDVDKINIALEEKKDKQLMGLWKKTRQLCLDAFEVIYKDLDTKFDVYFFEKDVDDRGKKIAQELLKKGLAKIDQEATVIDLKEYGLGIFLLLRKDGTVLYSAKDLALAERKFNEFKIERSIYVVGSEQRLYFSQLFKTLEIMGFEKAKNCVYVPVSLVRLPTGKMSSRTGDNIIYSDFKKEITDYAKLEIKKRYPNLSEKELESRALAISIAAIKYDMLKQDTNKTIIFDKKEALNFEGNSGPYIQYTYARASSILRKIRKGKTKVSKKTTPKDQKFILVNQEFSLVKQLEEFPEIIKSAYSQVSPNLIANYAYNLAQKFNEFYHSCQVIGSNEEPFRLRLVESTQIILRNSLYLLGISALEEM